MISPSRQRPPLDNRPAVRGVTAFDHGMIWGTTLVVLLGCQKQPDDPPTPPPSQEVCDPQGVATAEARLLTRSEYRRTVAALLGTSTDPTSEFPPEPVVDGFSNNAASHRVNPLLVEKYAQSAKLLANEAVERGLFLIHACGQISEQECAAEFISTFTARAYRRPVQDTELASLRGLYDRSVGALGHEQALGAVIEVVLQSPQFLYRIESPPSPKDGDIVRLGSYEMASRLSYFLQGGPPDEELLAAAAQDALSTKEQVAVQARRLLEDERSRSRIREFHHAWLGLERLGSVARNDAPEGFSKSLEESILQFTDSVFWDGDSSVTSLYTSEDVFADATLAQVLGLPVPEAGSWQRYKQPETRAGLLTQPALMSLLSHADQSSPIQRGVFIRDMVLCSPVPPPPPSVNNNPPDPEPGLTTRQLFEVHTESPTCAKCHSLIDPVGFGFEAYDQMGVYRGEQDGVSIDTSGELLGLEEEALLGPFNGAMEFSERIAVSNTALSCLAHQWFTFALGRGHSEEDKCSIDAALERAQVSGGNLKELLVGIASSDAFRFRAAHELDQAEGAR